MEESYGGDEKWKLSKKGRSRSGRTMMDATAQGSSTMLSRSYSASVTTTRTRTRHHHQGQQQCTSHSQSQQSSGSAGLSKKCVEAVKEHRARFYIVRRCVSMLVCWRDH